MSLAGQRGCLGCPQFSMDSFGRAIPRRENTFLSLMSDDMMIQMYPTEIAVVVVEREKKWNFFFNFSSSLSRIIICYLKMFQDDDIRLTHLYTQHKQQLNER